MFKNSPTEQRVDCARWLKTRRCCRYSANRKTKLNGLTYSWIRNACIFRASACGSCSPCCLPCFYIRIALTHTHLTCLFTRVFVIVFYVSVCEKDRPMRPPGGVPHWGPLTYGKRPRTSRLPEYALGVLVKSPPHNPLSNFSIFPSLSINSITYVHIYIFGT